MGLEGFDWVFLIGVSVDEALVIVEVNQVGCSVVLIVWVTFWAVPSKVSYFSALEAGVRRVPSSGGIPLEVVLGPIPLVSVGVLSSTEVIASVIPLIVSLGWHPVPINVHWNQGVIHPSRGVG